MTDAHTKPHGSATPGQSHVLSDGIRRARPAFVTVAVFSLFINLLVFIGPLYMLQVYDRVLSSRNPNTLLALTVLAALLYVSYALLEMFRSRVLVRAGILFDDHVGDPVFAAVHKATLRSPALAHTQALRDVDAVREFFTGSGFLALCDAPWFFVFIGACFLMHPWFGYFSIIGALIMLALAVANDLATRSTLQEASKKSVVANSKMVSTFRNSEVLEAMGMLGAARRIWQSHHGEVMALQANASDRAGVLIASSKFFRMFMQSAILGLGAYLAISRETTPGMMIAASILFGRALAPIDMLVGSWKSIVGVRAAYGRVVKILEFAGPDPKHMRLPRPEGRMDLEQVVFTPPNGRPILKGVGLQLAAGDIVGVIGPSGSGKSTLARIMVGVWLPTFGKVRLDGSELGHWHPEQLGAHIGYLPQDVELFDGTIAENIARLGDVDDARVLEAANLAGVHEIIQSMPAGYNTLIGDGGHVLSGGQRQRIGLARALYGNPSLVVLDEPNSNLDQAGEEALLAAVLDLKRREVTTILMTHRINILAAVDKIAVLADGQLQLFGPRDEVLARLTQPRVVAQQPQPPQVPAAGTA